MLSEEVLKVLFFNFSYKLALIKNGGENLVQYIFTFGFTGEVFNSISKYNYPKHQSGRMRPYILKEILYQQKG
ncbi:MAG TPA: hypothetical protein DCR43_01540 [Bacteroidales bacterium]|nr:MAG: hypothetical protein A2X11_10710 [Bacteroidetes bacterium GWE2_42_24]OFY28148.1 MAG: hypothetical protein A2X09_00965 [Bacteroidetes bacterium GWF2_43_11]HAQ64532.1 hypothetical protein [Bacteroidales bacterium]HBZ65531.1 hypothetical protein [Bacteroidales bacterium]